MVFIYLLIGALGVAICYFGVTMVFGSKWAANIMNLLSILGGDHVINHEDTGSKSVKKESSQLLGIALLVIGIGLFLYGILQVASILSR
ncbi:MAG: hypothetical protein HY430_03060 [Candidatus Levybacteria bacterium]|nr:hypothetical protein [Candidatus Levybacteria bacterium]